MFGSSFCSNGHSVATHEVSIPKCTLFCIWVLLLAVHANAQTFTYYVDSVQGSDRNPGSREAPWKSITKVNGTRLAPGNSVGLKRGGLWREALAIHDSGTATRPILIAAFGTGPLPIIDGSDILSSGWTAYGGKPNVWKHAFAPAYISHPWIFFDGFAGGPHGGNPQRSIAEINGPHEWYWDGKGMLYVYSTANPATAFTHPGIEATSRVGVQASEQAYVTFKEVEVRKTSESCFDLYRLSHGTVLKSIASYCGKRGIAVYYGSNYAVVADNTVTYSAETGIAVTDSSYARVYGNDVSHSGVLKDDEDGIGVASNAGKNYIYNNYVHDNTDQAGPIGTRGIELDTITYPNVNHVTGNVVTRCNHTGIVVQSSAGQRIWNNLSYENAHAVGGNCCVSGIKDVEGAGNIFINNTTFNNEFAEMQVHSDTGMGPVVENNIFYASRSGQGAIFTSGKTANSGTYDYNLAYGLTNPLYNLAGHWYTASTFYPSTGKGQHDVHANPLFQKDATSRIASFGFGIPLESPAKGKGTYITRITTARPVDLGAK